MTDKDGYVSCNFCGRHESFLVAGQRDTHICDCCAWDCAMLIYEKMKDRYNGEQTETVMEKPQYPNLPRLNELPENEQSILEDEDE